MSSTWQSILDWGFETNTKNSKVKAHCPRYRSQSLQTKENLFHSLCQPDTFPLEPVFSSLLGRVPRGLVTAHQRPPMLHTRNHNKNPLRTIRRVNVTDPIQFVPVQFNSGERNS